MRTLISTRKLACGAVAVAGVMALLPGVAGAQSASQVSVGSTIEVQNASECAPGAPVTLALQVGEASPIQIGTAVADETGHFETQVSMPGDVAEGPGAILVECGLDESVLTYEISLVAAGGGGIGSMVPYLLIAAALAALGGLVYVLLQRRSSDAEEATGTMLGPDGATRSRGDDGATPSAHTTPADPLAPPDVEPAAVTETTDSAETDEPLPAAVAAPRVVSAESMQADGDDDADYWFWETVTAAGPVRRLACVTELGFYLHEIPADQFQGVLERLVADGPDRVLAGAFVRIPVAHVDGVRRTGTVVHIDYMTQTGRTTRTVDLGAEVDGVVELLSRKVRVVTEEAPAATPAS